MSQPDFLYELFEDFMDDPANQDFSMDNGLVCRWMTGQAKISPKISAYYSKPSNQEKGASQRSPGKRSAPGALSIDDMFSRVRPLALPGLRRKLAK